MRKAASICLLYDAVLDEVSFLEGAAGRWGIAFMLEKEKTGCFQSAMTLSRLRVSSIPRGSGFDRFEDDAVVVDILGIKRGESYIVPSFVNQIKGVSRTVFENHNDLRRSKEPPELRQEFAYPDISLWEPVTEEHHFRLERFDIAYGAATLVCHHDLHPASAGEFLS